MGPSRSRCGPSGQRCCWGRTQPTELRLCPLLPNSHSGRRVPPPSLGPRGSEQWVRSLPAPSATRSLASPAIHSHPKTAHARSKRCLPKPIGTQPGCVLPAAPPPSPPRQFLSGAALLRIALQTRPRRSSLSARCCCNSGFSKLRLSGRRQEIRVTLATAVPCLLSRSVTSRGRRGSGPGPGGAEVSRSVAVCAALRRPHAEPPRFLPISAVSLSVFLSYRGARASCFQNIRAVSLLAGDKWKCLQPSFEEELKQGFFFSSCSPEEVTPRRSAGSPEANPRLCPSPAGGAEREGSLLQTAALA